MGVGQGETPEMKLRRTIDQSARAFSVALWRIAHGKPGRGGVVAELASITGLGPEAIRSRVDQCERFYPPPPIEPGHYDTCDDVDYMGLIMRDSAAPDTRDFLHGLSGGQRRDPDHEDPRVSRRRITRADGSIRLTSEAIDLPGNKH